MSLINTKIKPFKNQAFKNGEFIEVTEKDTEGRWSVFFFYPADFTFVCPTELGARLTAFSWRKACHSSPT